MLPELPVLCAPWSALLLSQDCLRVRVRVRVRVMVRVMFTFRVRDRLRVKFYFYLQKKTPILSIDMAVTVSKIGKVREWKAKRNQMKFSGKSL